MTRLNHASRMSYGSRNLLCLGIELSQSYPSGRPSGSRSAYLFSILDCSRPDFLRFHMQSTQRFTLRMAASKPTTLFAKTKLSKNTQNYDPYRPRNRIDPAFPAGIEPAFLSCTLIHYQKLSKIRGKILPFFNIRSLDTIRDFVWQSPLRL